MVISFKTVLSNLSIKSFQQCADLKLPGGATYLKSVFYNNSIYIFGGSLDTGFADRSIKRHLIDWDICSNDSVSSNNDWETIYEASTGFLTYYGSELVNYDNKDFLYIFGPYLDYGALWKYDFENNILHENTDKIVPSDGIRYCTAYDKSRNFIYVMGGNDVNGVIDSSKFLNIFDVTTDAFISNVTHVGFAQLSEFSDISPRSYGQCVYDDVTDSIFYFGGIDTDYVVLSTVLSYNITKSVWQIEWNEMQDDRGDFTLVKIDRKVWLFGGYSAAIANSLDDIEMYNLDTRTSRYATYNDSPITMHSHNWGVSGWLHEFLICICFLCVVFKLWLMKKKELTQMFFRFLLCEDRLVSLFCFFFSLFGAV